MANKSMFASMRGKLLPAATVLNGAGGTAFELSPRQKLAQLAVTGCLNGTFYASAQDQLTDVLDLTRELDPAFIAKTAIYARKSGFMKDMPALLLACLTVPNSKGEMRSDLVAPVFHEVIDNGKMLRNFVQIMRSGVVGRKSLGTAPKRLVQNWLLKASDKQLINACVGNDPSLADVIKMVHPKPLTADREALFAYLIGREHDFSKLPQSIKDFEAFKADISSGGAIVVPDVPFQMLTALNLNSDHWTQISERGGWHMVRMNLNTFARHGVFERRSAVKAIAKRLTDVDAIRRAKVFPYQIMAAYMASQKSDLPREITQALKEALEISLENVPSFDGNVVVCPDVSGSMSWSVSGYRAGSTSAVRCIDVAGLMASVVLRNSDAATVLPFEVCIADVKLNAKDDVLTNTGKLSAIGGGGTNCAAPLVHLNRRKAKVDLLIIVSDNESWAGVQAGRSTAMMGEWERLKTRNPKARMVCIDITPNTTTQAVSREDILNIGGFSDRVFDVIGRFANGNTGSDHWVGEIETLELRSIN
ncbi:MAG: RNA-binding protein [Hellea sp.]